MTTKLFLTALFLILFSNTQAQISAGGSPRSQHETALAAPPTLSLPSHNSADMWRAELLSVQQAQANGDAVAPHIAYPHEVNLNLNNSGSWTTLPDGTRIWRLRLVSPGALATMLVFERWRLSKGAELFLYDDEQTDVRGAFTLENNWDSGRNITAPLPGEAVTLELNIPSWQDDLGELSILRVGHVYCPNFGREQDALDEFGESLACHVNVNCPEGADWQDEKRGVALIISDGFRWCSGSLIRNACNPVDPLFLSAWHCLDGNEASWVFVFNYESAGCANPPSEPSTSQSISNATLLASHNYTAGADLALFRLSSPPPLAYNAYINGWDRRDIPREWSVGIHHPIGDIKKISGDDDPYTEDSWLNVTPNTHWEMTSEWGGLEGGSSGSPLFNPGSRIVGDLTGGLPGCAAPHRHALYGKLSFNWTGGGTPQTRLSDHLDPCATGVEYTDGINVGVAPANDLCENAINIGTGIEALPYTHSGTTMWAQNNYETNCGSSDFPGPDVVYRWKAGCCSTEVIVSLCGSANWDTGLHVRRDACNGNAVTCNDDECELKSAVSFIAEPKVTYYFFVDGYNHSSAGNYTISVSGSLISPAPLNDHCAGSLAITSLPYTHAGSTCLATNDRVNCVGGASRDVFYHLNLPTCQTVTVSTCDNTCFDTGLEVRTGGNCPGSDLVACSDDECITQSWINFNAAVGQSYYIIVHGYDASAYGEYELNVSGTPNIPPNDNCENDTTISFLPYSISSSTECATVSSVNCGGVAARDVFYRYTPASCGRVTASLCGSPYDTRLEVRAGGGCPGEFEIGCNDDFCGVQSQVSFDAAQGVTYYFIISGYGVEDAGMYTLNVSGVTQAPVNDLCAGATTIALPFNTIGSTSCATDLVSGCYGVSGSHDVIYRYIHPVGSPCDDIHVSVCGSLYDTGLQIRTGACPGNVTVTCVDDGFCDGESNTAGSLSFSATEGAEYWIHVDGFSWGSNGVYELHIAPECQPQELVIHRSGNDAVLNWRHVEWSGAVYSVYGSDEINVTPVSANLVGTTTDSTYTHVGIVAGGEPMKFYVVTAGP